MFTCDTCRTRDEMERLRANTIAGLLKRLGLAFLRLFRKPKPLTAMPRFYCVICREYVEPKNVLPVAAPLLSSEGAVGETFLGFVYNVTCHGETRQEYVTLVASMVGSFCHHDAFRQPMADGPAYVWEESPEQRETRLAAVARYEERLQKEIAQANQVRTEWLAQNNISIKLEELRQLVQNLPAPLAPKEYASGLGTDE